jgi:hypothetical protein
MDWISIFRWKLIRLSESNWIAMFSWWLQSCRLPQTTGDRNLNMLRC